MMSSSSFFTNLPLMRIRLSAKFFRTSYLTFFVHTRFVRLSGGAWGQHQEQQEEGQGQGEGVTEELVDALSPLLGGVCANVAQLLGIGRQDDLLPGGRVVGRLAVRDVHMVMV